MNKKLIKKLIIWAIFIALVVTAIILLVTVVNKKETTPIFQTDGTTLVKYNGKDEEVVISKDIEIIGKSAFQSNDKLKKLTFESGSKIKAISRRAFEDCSKLEEIELPNTITSIGSSAFDGCTSLTNVTLPSALASLDFGAFYDCISLQAITLNEGLETIGEDAFYNCGKLVDVTLPSTLVSLGANAFYNCTALNLSVASNNTNYVITKNVLYHNVENNKKELVLSLDSTITEIKNIDASVVTICANAYYNASKVTTIDIPTTVTTIEENAFSGCAQVSDVTLPFIGTSIDSSFAFKAVFGNSTQNIRLVTIKQGTRIIEKAFKNLSTIRSIDLPNTITSLGSEAFAGCTSLQNVTNLPTNLEKINASTFEGCPSLREEVLTSLINSNLKVIEQKAFAGCTKLTKIDLPNNVISIGVGAYEGCTGVTEAVLPFIGSGYKYDSKTLVKKEFNSAEIFGYIFNSNGVGDTTNSKTLDNLITLTITGTYDIPENAFVNCKSLVTINLPNEITSIGDYAFKGCTSLVNMVLPTSLTNLGMNAFQNCTVLESVTLPESLTTLKDDTFRNCSHLKEIDLTYIISLGKNVLYGCDESIRIIINSSNQKYQVIDNSLYTADDENGMRELVYYVPSVDGEGNVKDTFTVDDKVSVIRSGAFANQRNLKTLVISNTVKEIQTGAIVNCTALTNITLPFIGTMSEGSIGRDESFESIFAENKPEELEVTITNCTEVPSLAFMSSIIIKKITITDSNLQTIGAYAFAGCTNLSEIVLGEGITTIEEYAFLGCVGITNLQIPNSVRKLGDYALADCSNIESINIPDGLEKLGVGVFRSWSSLKNFTINPNHERYSIENTSEGSNVCQVLCSKDKTTLILYMPSNKVSSYTVPTTITSIDAYAFSGASLRSVVITDQVTSLGNGLFYNCNKLRSVTLPANTTTVKYSMFENCYALTTIENTANIEEIEGRAFLMCTSLENVPVTEKVTLIGESAFEGCEQIKSVVIPATMTSIPKFAFKDCKNLSDVTFPESITIVGESAFEGCSKLTYIELKEGLITIEDKAFANCCQSFVYEVDENGEVKKDADGNSIRKELLIKIPTTVESIGRQAFIGCRGATKIYLPVEVDKDGKIIRAASYVGDEAFGSMATTTFFTEGIVRLLDEEGNATGEKTYPAGWSKALDQQMGTSLYRGEFKLDSNGVPVSLNDNSNNDNTGTEIPKRDTKPGQCDYKENLGYYFMITATLVSGVVLLRKKQNH